MGIVLTLAFAAVTSPPVSPPPATVAQGSDGSITVNVEVPNQERLAAVFVRMDQLHGLRPVDRVCYRPTIVETFYGFFGNPRGPFSLAEITAYVNLWLRAGTRDSFDLIHDVAYLWGVDPHPNTEPEEWERNGIVFEPRVLARDINMNTDVVFMSGAFEHCENCVGIGFQFRITLAAPLAEHN